MLLFYSILYNIEYFSSGMFHNANSDKLLELYQIIQKSELVKLKIPTIKNVKLFEKNINKAQTIGYTTGRQLTRCLYKCDSSAFIKYINKIKFHHLILWTESKNIVKFFNLEGVVYIKWTGNNYVCSIHRNYKNNVFIIDTLNNI
jgi:hypothetical protein